MNKFLSYVILSFALLINTTPNLKATEKKCFYCKKYKYLKDWPVKERPIAFVYEEIVYPKGMFDDKALKNKEILKKRAGKKVAHRFVKAKGQLNKYQHLMIRDSAYFEVMFNEKLNEKLAKVESLESLKKARDAIRQSLKISPNASSSEAIYKFWATGKIMTKIYNQNKKNKKKKKKDDEEIIKRVKILNDLKKQITITKSNAQKAATIEADKSIND